MIYLFKIDFDEWSLAKKFRNLSRLDLMKDVKGKWRSTDSWKEFKSGILALPLIILSQFLIANFLASRDNGVNSSSNKTLSLVVCFVFSYTLLSFFSFVISGSCCGSEEFKIRYLLVQQSGGGLHYYPIKEIFLLCY